MICIEQTYLECIKPERNKRAYYRLVIGYDLFGLKVIRSWGRIGTKERPRRNDRVNNLDEARKLAGKVLKTRYAHGYTVVGACHDPLRLPPKRGIIFPEERRDAALQQF